MFKMRPELWIVFAAAALQKTANGDTSDNNHESAAKEAGKYADAMCDAFEDRFEKKEEKFEFPVSATFESAQVDGDPSAPTIGDDSLLAGSGSHKYPDPGVTDWTDQDKPDFEKPVKNALVEMPADAHVAKADKHADKKHPHK